MRHYGIALSVVLSVFTLGSAAVVYGGDRVAEGEQEFEGPPDLGEVPLAVYSAAGDPEEDPVEEAECDPVIFSDVYAVDTVQAESVSGMTEISVVITKSGAKYRLPISITMFDFEEAVELCLFSADGEE